MKKVTGVCLLFPACLVAYAQSVPLFETLNGTGVNFRNVLDESPTANVLTYEYFYNGGGVAIGDINNDGLEDIYFTANMRPNALYLNQGNFKFKDITKSAGVLCEQGWKTGVTMADVNHDGLLDIYVCFSGKGDPDRRKNKLFINNGDLTFSEKASAFGLDDPGHSTHASFFDFDNDGDLDMYLLNHNVAVIQEFEFAKARTSRHPYAGDKLYRNDDGHYADVSETAGIKGNALGFGLGVAVADVNQDGWMDIYVSNDYVEPDYLYINNGNGTFTDHLTDYMQHISYFSMGCDVSDINNDALPDIYTLDMLPEDNERQKLLYGPENYEHYALMVLNGFYFQNMRNMLHLNNGNGTFSEIGQFAGISNTDWSWAPLFADFDNDGLKDLFVSNGYYRDYTNRDFLKNKGDYYFEMGKAGQKADTFHLVSTMTSTPIRNYVFRNRGDLTFEDKSVAWGFKEKSFSSGASYADLDNDGDLDLVVSNQNANASIYRNRSREANKELHYLQVQLSGDGKNTRGIGAKVFAYVDGGVQYFEQMFTRGFQSSITDRIHIGLGKHERVDSIIVKWPRGNVTRLNNVAADQTLRIAESDATLNDVASLTNAQPLFSSVDNIISFTHVEQGFNDFKRQPLLMTMLTPCGPAMATADVNGDGRADLYAGGADGTPGQLFLQSADGTFQAGEVQFENRYTDSDAVFFDVDGDGDNDLYIVSGGYNDFKSGSLALQDRLYINDGKGKFTFAKDKLPPMGVAKSCVAVADYDRDGDLDLFVGGRVIPGEYPVIPESYLLENTGGAFRRVEHERTGALTRAGMVTDAEWVDFNGDSWPDLIVAGEFMPIEVFINKEGKGFESETSHYFDEPMTGLWNRIVLHDFDNDGDMDLIAGNFGLNSQLDASASEPLELYYKDFDRNGSVDPILTHYIQHKPYPFPSRDELLDQMYSMRSKFTNYASYAKASLPNLFSKSDLKDAKVSRATTLETTYFENRDGKFVARPFPREAQFSPVYAIAVSDFDGDGKTDIVLAGNQSSIRIRLGVIDANFGQLFRGNGKGDFSYVRQPVSGFKLTGDARSLKTITVNGEDYLLVGINNVGIATYRVNKRVVTTFTKQ